MYNKKKKVFYPKQKSKDLIPTDEFKADKLKFTESSSVSFSNDFEVRKASLELAINWFKNHPEESIKGNIEPEDIVDLAMYFETYFKNVNPAKL
jgi:hypothetical protein